MAVKDKRLHALDIMIKKQNIDLIGARVDVQRAEKLESELKESLDKLVKNVEIIEEEARFLSEKNMNINMADMQLRRVYLSQQRKLVLKEEKEKEHVSKLVDQMNKKLTEQRTSLKLYENLHDKQYGFLKNEENKKEYIELDEVCSISRQTKL